MDDSQGASLAEAPAEGSTPEAAASPPADKGAEPAAEATQAEGEAARKTALSEGEGGEKADGAGDVAAAADEAEKAPDGDVKADESEAEAGDKDKAEEKPAKKDDEKAEEAEAEKPKIEGLPDDFDWRTLAIDEKNKNVAKHFNSVDEVLTKNREYVSLLRKSVEIPNTQSSAEVVAKFHKAIGVPETPDGYRIDLADDAEEHDKQYVERLKLAAHGVHMTPAQLTALADWQRSESAAAQARDDQEHRDHLARLKTDLAREWGGSTDRNLGEGDRFLHRFLGDQYEEFKDMQLADGSYAINHPILVRMAARAGRSYSEAGIPGEVVADGWKPTEGELVKMQQEPGYVDGTDKELIKRVTIGYKRLYDK
jgi:hypothetical protein